MANVDWTQRLKEKNMSGEDKDFRSFSFVDEERRVVYCVVLNSKGDPYKGGKWDEGDIINSAHFYMQHFQRVTYLHEIDIPKDDVVIVESYIALNDIPNDDPDMYVHAGSWVIGLKVLNDTLWGAVKEGKITGVSAGGFIREVGV